MQNEPHLHIHYPIAYEDEVHKLLISGKNLVVVDSGKNSWVFSAFQKTINLDYNTMGFAWDGIFIESAYSVIDFQPGQFYPDQFILIVSIMSSSQLRVALNDENGELYELYEISEEILYYLNEEIAFQEILKILINMYEAEESEIYDDFIEILQELLCLA